ncbi:MAG: hypothetical protein MR009_04165 [Sutterellaceae bacterium]|nr:hypothetical protein [Sutterellaceae bacterium]MDD7442353.1 hypothetical protein [Sutterellaceae bacterium]MDY2868990.1 hypothetical protein [Mesosutterella sp.]
MTERKIESKDSAFVKKMMERIAARVAAKREAGEDRCANPRDRAWLEALKGIDAAYGVAA